MHLEKTFKTLITYNLGFSNHLSNAGINPPLLQLPDAPNQHISYLQQETLFFMILKHSLKKVSILSRSRSGVTRQPKYSRKIFPSHSAATAASFSPSQAPAEIKIQLNLGQ